MSVNEQYDELRELVEKWRDEVTDINEQLAEDNDRFKNGYRGAKSSCADELEEVLLE